MKFKNVLLAALPIVMLNVVSCTKDDVAAPTKENIAILPYTAPSTYDFSRNSASSVDVSEEKTRILMLTEIGTYITSGTTATLDATKLANMYSNSNNPFTTVSGVPSSIDLKDKTATSVDYFGGGNAESTDVQNSFIAAFNNAVAASTSGVPASAGVPGIYTPATGSKRLFTATWIDVSQVVKKGMMGAHMMDQVLNHFLSVKVLDAGNNRMDNATKVVVAGKNYTEMEHAWDQAYGQIYGGGLSSSNKKYFWDSYIDQVAGQTTAFNSLTTDIKNAFIKGRAAITGNDYAERDRQIAIIKQKFSLIPAIRAAHYLWQGKDALGTHQDAFGGISEGYGFVMNLRYTNNPATNQPYFTKAEVDAMLNQLNSGSGLYDYDNIGAKLDAVATQISTRFSFSKEDAIQGAG